MMIDKIQTEHLQKLIGLGAKISGLNPNVKNESSVKEFAESIIEFYRLLNLLQDYQAIQIVGRKDWEKEFIDRHYEFPRVVMAMYDELGELSASTGYQWWKKVKDGNEGQFFEISKYLQIDHNYLLELVDLIHFMITADLVFIKNKFCIPIYELVYKSECNGNLCDFVIAGYERFNLVLVNKGIRTIFDITITINEIVKTYGEAIWDSRLWNESDNYPLDHPLQFLTLPSTAPLTVAADHFVVLYISPVIHLLVFLYTVEPDVIRRIAYLYAGKMILNLFRHANGYKKGKYIKIWDKKNNLEDNFFLARFLKKVENEKLELNVEDIMQFLGDTYINVVNQK